MATQQELPHRAVTGFPALLGVLKKGPLLQKETGSQGGCNNIPSETMLDPPSNQMRSELLFPLRGEGTEAQNGQVTHLRPHSK